MRNKLEHILLSVLLGLSILLGLSFWLNTSFGFNLFLKEHWDTLAQLQVTKTPVNPWFYISIIIAVVLFIFGLLIINIPSIKHKPATDKKQNIVKPDTNQNIPHIETKEEHAPENIPTPVETHLSRPPRLNLPKNMAEIAEQRHTNQSYTTTKSQNIFTQNTSTESPYNSVLSQIFSEAKYVVKPNPTISGFTPNLFAIGNNEAVWIGAVDCKIEDLKNAVQKLQSVFEDTLPDIPIHIYPFIVDNLDIVTPESSVLVVKNIDDLKKFISENPADDIDEDEQDSFNSYSEYIDTIIQYIKNV